jgi:two-component system cell cycle response regulator CpdR
MGRVVLVVDDEPLVLMLTSSMLEDLGCEVVTADSGQRALDWLSADRRIEVLITDIKMPGMDGYELIAKARNALPHLQVLIRSAHAKAELESGLTVIRKPFSQEELARTMAHTMELC